MRRYPIFLIILLVVATAVGVAIDSQEWASGQAGTAGTLPQPEPTPVTLEDIWFLLQIDREISTQQTESIITSVLSNSTKLDEMQDQIRRQNARTRRLINRLEAEHDAEALQ